MPAERENGATAVYVLTGQGLAVARRLEAALGAHLYVSASLTDGVFADQVAIEEMPSTAGALRGACAPDPGIPPGEMISPCSPRHCPVMDCDSASVARHFTNLADMVRENFQKYACHIFIAAAGIAVRVTAPLLRGKALDPAVLVIDQRGRFVISLLSGHLGGGNAMAARAAAALGATPVITTATDVEDLPALDVLAREKNLAIANLEAVKAASAALLAGRSVLLHDPDNCLGLRGSRWGALFQDEPDLGRALEPDSASAVRVIVTERDVFRSPAAPGAAPGLPAGRLILHPRRLFVGVGCRKGAPEQDILRHIRAVLASAGLAPEAVAGLASIEGKRDEPGLLRAAESLGLPLRFFSAAELAAYPVSAPSPKAVKRFGVQGVCEPAALAAAGKGARLAVAKTADRNVTVAVALTGPAK